MITQISKSGYTDKKIRLVLIFLAQVILVTKILPAKELPNRGAICHGSREKKLIALTFDACQRDTLAGYDKEIVDILKKTNTPATLFLGGNWIESHCEVVRELSSDTLFEIANHSYSHLHLTKCPAEQVLEEIKKTQDIIKKITGREAVLFRAPFGEFDTQVLKIAAQLGLKTVQWDVVSGDPDPRVLSAKMIKEVTSVAKNGSIIIFHVNKKGWHTAQALPAIIKKLREKNFQFVTVSELLN